MKTLQDLADRLNEFDNPKRFSILKQYGVAYLEARDSTGVKYRLIYFEDYIYRIKQNFPSLQPFEQKVIIDFLANSNPKYWFAEKKYNIIVGIDSSSSFFGAYKKDDFGGYSIMSASEGALLESGYEFTESEIEELKSQLPESMAKIVELGKVEVERD